MEQAEFLLPLPDGRLASYEAILSPFLLYTVPKHPNLYLLIPKSEQENLKGIVIVASENKIRICHHKGWPNMMVSKLLNLTDCKHLDGIIQIQLCKIPSDVQYSICSNLIKSLTSN